MHILIKTLVKGNYLKIIKRFDRELFETLSPPGAQIKLVRFDGSKTGDIVHLQLKLMGLIKQDWISEITSDGQDDQKAFFIDEGKQLPFFLTSWKHRHVVENKNDHSEIIDDIHFKTPSWLTDVLLYPVLYLQFVYRKPVYRKIFGSANH